MTRDRVSRVRDRVELFLAEDGAERLSEWRDLQRRAVHDRNARKLEMLSAGIPGSIDNLVPVVHLLRARRDTPRPLATLRHQCWTSGYRNGVEVDARRDFPNVLIQWARQRRGEWDLDSDPPQPDELADAVVSRLHASRCWKVALGFVPIAGPIAAYRIDRALAIRFRDLATEYFRRLQACGVRPLPADFAIPPSSRRDRDEKADDSTESTLRTVERFLAEHRSEEHLYHVRGMARIGQSARSARWIAGSSGLFTNLIPIRHLHRRFRDLDTNMFLTTLQEIWWQAAANAGRDDDTGDDFERVLLLWTGGRQHDETPSRGELIAAVSSKLQAASLWKLAFGFLPLIGAVMGLMIEGSMAARLYRLAKRFYEQREPLARIGR